MLSCDFEGAPHLEDLKMKKLKNITALLLGTLTMLGLGTNWILQRSPVIQEKKDSLPVIQVSTQSSSTLHAPVPPKRVDSLTQEQQNIKAYIADKFQVDPASAAEVVQHAYKVSDETGVHPHLLLAVAAVESSFDPSADSGGAKGLMQIQASAHKSEIRAMGGVRGLFDVRKNLELGAEILQDCLTQVNNNLRKALLRYNGSSRPSSKYPEKVMREKARLDAAAVAYISE